jgi:hypothetical protein
VTSQPDEVRRFCEGARSNPVLPLAAGETLRIGAERHVPPPSSEKSGIGAYRPCRASRRKSLHHTVCRPPSMQTGGVHGLRFCETHRRGRPASLWSVSNADRRFPGRHAGRPGGQGCTCLCCEQLNQAWRRSAAAPLAHLQHPVGDVAQCDRAAHSNHAHSLSFVGAQPCNGQSLAR